MTKECNERLLREALAPKRCSHFAFASTTARAQGPSLLFNAPLGNRSLYTLRRTRSLDALPFLGTCIPSKPKLLGDLRTRAKPVA